MNKHYRDYFWRDCLPYGLEPLDDAKGEISYKIVMDPYRKRVSLEKYNAEQFQTTVYDSALLNFKYLNPIEQQSWQKSPFKEFSNTLECIIRDQDDRVLFIETYSFQDHYCKTCTARSPQGVILSIQEMHYKALGERENEVILYDTNDHPIIHKIYEADAQTGEFTTLIKEIKDMNGVQLGKNKIRE